MAVFRRLLFQNLRLVYFLSDRLRHRFTPGGLLIFSGLIAAGVFGLDTRQTLAYQVFSLLAALLLLSFLGIFTFRGKFRVQRLLPRFGTAGTPLQYGFIVENLGKTPQEELLLIDELEQEMPRFEEFRSSRDPDDRQRNLFDRVVGYPRLVALIGKKRGASIKPAEIDPVAGGERVECKVQLLPVRRGYLHFHRSRIARPEPLGLMRSFRTFTGSEELLILPRLYTVPTVRLPGKRKYQHGGMHMARSVGDSEEFFSLRDYRPGDPLRAIHWRSYAKKGEPIVREYQDEYFVRQGLILDTFLERRPDIILEEAVSVAASFAVSIREQDALLDLLLTDTRACRYTSGRGLSGVEYMLEVLACITAAKGSSFDSLRTFVLRHCAETSGFICILLDWDEPRKRLVRELRALDIPVQVIVITAAGGIERSAADPLSDQPERFWVLEAGNIQPCLDRNAA